MTDTVQKAWVTLQRALLNYECDRNVAYWWLAMVALEKWHVAKRAEEES